MTPASAVPHLRRLLALLAITVLLPTFCWGWGREGHRIIATVAEDHLNETTKVMTRVNT